MIPLPLTLFIVLMALVGMVFCGVKLFELLDMGRNPEKYNGDDSE